LVASLRISYFSSLSILIFLLLTIFAGFELGFLARESYFSDSEYYYRAYNSTQNCTSYHGAGFVCYARFFATILDHSEFIVFHITLYIFLLFSVARTIRTVEPKLAHIIILCFSHPFVAFVFVRGLKEIILILTVTLASLMIINCGYIIKKLGLLPFLYTFSVTRPLGLPLVALALISSRFMPRLMIATFLALVVAHLPIGFVPIFGPYLAEHAMLFVESGFSSGSSLAPVKFILGPTPLKPFLAFFEPSIYQYGTLITLMILFVGSLYSLYICILFLCHFRKIPAPLSYASNIFFVVAFVTLIIYSMIYGGSVDTRHRAFFFVMFASGILLRAKGK
jgi:hypothetical protein